MIASLASVAFSFQTSDEAIEIEARFIKALSGKSIRCPFSDSTCDASDTFSNFDGSCHNIDNPQYGSIETPFRRLLSAAYADGQNSPRALGVSGEALPNPRTISTTLQGDNNREEPIWTHIWVTFGQFLTHDIAETSLSSIDGSKPSCPCDSTEYSCHSIEMPEDDTMNTTCLEFVRSSASFADLSCEGETREQLNLINSYIDASTVYGNSKDAADELRVFEGGLLLTTDGVDNDRTYLPADDSTCSSTDDATMTCFKSGDARTSENLGLTGIHSVFVREHNRIATELAALNPDFSDSKLYKNTRRILIAILQHIVYDQYVPSIIGNAGNIDYDLDPTTDDSYFTGHNTSVNSQLFNEFATAAMRFGHSVVHNIYARYGTDNTEIDSELTFSDINFKSEEAYNEDMGGIDSIVRGLINTNPGRLDMSIASDLTNKLMDTPSGDFIDLAAFNINRGRDHGLQPYIKYVEYCTGNTITSFQDLIDLELIEEKTANRMSRVYDNVGDIDLWVGGLAETAVGAADVITGPTFTCIIGEQFSELKKGDRFYYENAPDASKGTENSAFTIAQLTEIKKMSLSHLLCNNLDIDSIQADVFFVDTGIRPRNEKQACSTYENMDLSVF